MATAENRTIETNGERGTPRRSIAIPATTLAAATSLTAGVADARNFIAFVQSSEGHAIMRKYGFLLPGESLAQSTPGNPAP